MTWRSHGGWAATALVGLLIGCPHRGITTKPDLPLPPVVSPPTSPATFEEHRFVPTDAYYHYLVARLAAERGDCGLAIDHYRRAVSHDPESSFLHQASAECMLRLGRLQAGLQAAERAVEVDANNLDAKLLLSRAYLIAHDEPAARRSLGEILEADPAHRQATELLAEIALADGDEDRAIELIGSIAQADPSDPHPTYFLGQLFFRRGKLDQAINFLQRTLERDPGHTRAHDLLIAALERQKRFVDAAAAAAAFSAFNLGALEPRLTQLRMLALAGEREKLEALLNELRDEEDNDQQVDAALAVARGGEERVALELLDEVTNRDPDHDAARIAAGRILARRGKLKRSLASYDHVPVESRLFPDAMAEGADVLLRSGRHDHAAQRLQRAITLYPDRQELRIQLADLEARLGRPKRALELLEAIPTEQRGRPRVLSALSHALLEVGRKDDSVDLVLAAMSSAPDDPELLIILALAYERAGRHEESEGAARQLLASFPDSVAAQNFLAYTYALRDRRLDEALDLAQRASASAPDDGYVADTLGYVFYKLGRHEDAREALQRANRLSPDEPEILLHLGDVERALGRQEAAVRHYRRAAQLLPRDEAVRSALNTRLGRAAVKR